MSSILIKKGRDFYVKAKKTVFEPEYQNLLDYWNGEGYDLPTSSQQKKQNNLVATIKSVMPWSDIATIYFCKQNNKDIAKTNWVNPGTFDLIEVNNPTFTPLEGFSTTGTEYLRNGWIPSQQSLITTSNSFYLQNENVQWGARNGLNNRYLSRRLALPNREFNNFNFGSNISDVQIPTSDENKTVSCLRNNNNIFIYVNGLLEKSVNDITQTPLTTVELFFLCNNNNGTPNTFGGPFNFFMNSKIPNINDVITINNAFSL